MDNLAHLSQYKLGGSTIQKETKEIKEWGDVVDGAAAAGDIVDIARIMELMATTPDVMLEESPLKSRSDGFGSSRN